MRRRVSRFLSRLVEIHLWNIRNWATGRCLDAFANVNYCYNGGSDAWQQWRVLLQNKALPA